MPGSPVAAYEAWITAASLTEGPVFRGIDRWGHLSGESLHVGSFVPLLRALFRAAGVPAPDSYSSHSLRRGFASWANASGWDIKLLMEYVGWKDVRSAMRYCARVEDGCAGRAGARFAESVDAPHPEVAFNIEFRPPVKERAEIGVWESQGEEQMV